MSCLPTSSEASAIYQRGCITGVNSDEAVALRLLGVPRTAAPALAKGLSVKAGEPLHQIRGRLRAADVSEWTKVMGDRGVSCHRVWSIIEGES